MPRKTISNSSKKAKASGRARRRPEAFIQKQFVSWQRKAFPTLMLFHIPNGGTGSVVKLAELNAMGQLPGIPDIAFIKADNKVAFIEFKSPRGVLSEEQKLFRDLCCSRGVEWHLCRSAKEAAKVLIDLAKEGQI